MLEPVWTEREQPDVVLKVESAQDEHALKLYADRVVRFLSLYTHLADSYVLDFFVADSWRSLPACWGECLDGFSADDLADFITPPAVDAASGWPPRAGVAPLSLLCFRACCCSLALSRRPVTSPATVAAFLQRTPSGERSEEDRSVRSKQWPHPNQSPSAVTSPSRLDEVDADSAAKRSQGALTECGGSVQSDGLSPAAPALVDAAGDCRAPPDRPSASVAETWPADAGAELSPGGGQLKLLDAVFRRCVKPKKQHELRRLARLVELTSPRLVVDLGSGQGHLSRFLAYHCRLQVVCLESNPAFVAGARKLDGTLEKAMLKRREQALRRLQRGPEKANVVKELTSENGHPDDPLPERPLHSACHITADMDHQKFAQMLCRLTGCEPGALQFSCVGLHTCGDLAALQLRQFVQSPHCAAVVSVGCCYMKLSTPRDGGGGWCGYPLSQHVARQSARCGYHMSYAAREVACHAIEEYAARLRAGGEQQLKIHAYRAALERALVAFDPGLRHAGLRSVLRGHLLTFPEYVERALERPPQRVDRGAQRAAVSAAQLDLSASAADLAQWRRVVVYYSLRLLLAPVVESLILVDRLLYLSQHGHSSLLLAAFDPKLSPRNFVIISKKR